MRLPVRVCRECGGEKMWLETPNGDWELLNGQPSPDGIFFLVPDPLSPRPEGVPPIAMAVSRSKKNLKENNKKRKGDDDLDLMFDDGTRYAKHECEGSLEGVDHGGDVIQLRGAARGPTPA